MGGCVGEKGRVGAGRGADKRDEQRVCRRSDLLHAPAFPPPACKRERETAYWVSFVGGENGPGQHPRGIAKIGMLWAWLPKCGACSGGVIAIFPPPQALHRWGGKGCLQVVLRSEPGRLSEVMLREFLKEGETLRFSFMAPTMNTCRPLLPIHCLLSKILQLPP